MKDKKIIFVCTGNTCRSPMAEAILRSELKRMHIDGVTVLSAGINASKNGNINPKSAAVLSEKGLSLENFNSRLLDGELMESAYAIVCMTDAQRDILMDFRWQILRKSGAAEIENNVYSFSDVAGYEIPDPFGKDMECYRFTFEKLSEGMASVIERFCKEKEAPTEIPKQEKPKKKPTSKGTKTTQSKGRTKKNSTKSTKSKKVAPKGKPNT